VLILLLLPYSIGGHYIRVVILELTWITLLHNRSGYAVQFMWNPLEA
jgi:hypothetical protein